MGLLGIQFPFGIGQAGLPGQSTEDGLIFDSIRRIVMTGRGERIMRPSSGSRVINMVFENRTQALGARLAEEIKQSLRSQEKRIQVISVTTTFVDDVTIQINVIYKRVGTLKRATFKINRDAVAV